MSLNAGAAAWQKPTRSVPGRAAKLVLASAVALLAGQYLAGFLFLWSVHADVRSASPLTVARYGYYYGQHPVDSSSTLGFVRCRFHPGGGDVGGLVAATATGTPWRCPLRDTPGDRRRRTLRPRGDHFGGPRETLSDARRPAGRGARRAPACR